MLKKAKLAYQKGYRMNAKGDIFGLQGQLMKLRKGTNGYLCFNFWANNKKQTICAHRLQAYCLFGEELYKNNMQVRHLDGNPLNNMIDNISIGTQSDNMMDISSNIRRYKAVTAGHARSLLTKNNVITIRQLREQKQYTYAQIRALYPMAKSTLSYILNYKTWKFIEIKFGTEGSLKIG